MGDEKRVKIHPLAEKRHRIFSTWWGALIRSDDWIVAVTSSFVLVFIFSLFTLRTRAFPDFILNVVEGFVLGTLLEYISHRFSFHQLWKVRGFRGLEDIHMPHHVEPNDGINAGPFFFLPLYLILGLLLTALAGDAAIGLGWLSGIGLWFSAYEYCHANLHLEDRHPGRHFHRTRYMRFMKGFHQHHHDQDWTMNFGITQPAWDWVFRTLSLKRKNAAP